MEIHVQALCEPERGTVPAFPRGFAMSTATPGPTPAPRPWRQSDVRRAIAAAEQAELKFYRVAITPDGAISIIVGEPQA